MREMVWNGRSSHKNRRTTDGAGLRGLGWGQTHLPLARAEGPAHAMAEPTGARARCETETTCANELHVYPACLGAGAPSRLLGTLPSPAHQVCGTRAPTVSEPLDTTLGEHRQPFLRTRALVRKALRKEGLEGRTSCG